MPRRKQPDATKQGIEFHMDHQGEFDELWLSNANIHIERMADRSFWMGVEVPGGPRLMVNTGVVNGKWFFNIQEDSIGAPFHSVQRPSCYSKKHRRRP